MKKIYTLIICCFLSFLNFSQVDWKQIPLPSNFINYSIISYEFQSFNNGETYSLYVYNDGSNDIFQVDMFDKNTLNWNYYYHDYLQYSSNILKTDFRNDSLYVSVISSDDTSSYFNLYSLNNGMISNNFKKLCTTINNNSAVNVFKSLGKDRFYWINRLFQSNDYILNKFNVSNNTIEEYPITQWSDNDIYNCQFEEQGDSLYIIASESNYEGEIFNPQSIEYPFTQPNEINDVLRILTTHKENINIIPYGNINNGYFYNDTNLVLCYNCITNGNNDDKISIITEDEIGNKVEVNIFNGIANISNFTGFIVPQYNNIVDASSKNKQIYFGSFYNDNSYYDSKTMVLERPFFSNLWDTIGSINTQILSTSYYLDIIDLSYNEKTNKYITKFTDYSNGNDQYLYFSNTLPQQDSIIAKLENTLCPTNNFMNLFKEFTVWDENFDQVSLIGITSSNQSVINNSNITYYTNGFQNGRTSFNVSISNTSLGTTSLSFYLSDGYDTITFVKDVTIGDYQISSASGQDICGEGYSNINAITNVGTGYYTWYDSIVGGNYVAWDDTTSIYLTETSTIYVEATENNCTTNRFKVDINVFDLPIVNPLTNFSVCQGDSVILSGSGSPFLTYTWDNNVIDGVKFLPTYSQWYNLIGTDTNNCSSSSSVYLTVNDLPIISIYTNNSSVCIGQNTTLTAYGGDTYVWSNSLTGSSIDVTPNQNTNYYVVGTDYNGCNNIDSISIDVFPLPSANITINGNTSFCEGESVELIAENSTYYYWNNSQTSQSIYVFSSGLYYVTVVDTNNCSNTSDTITITTNPLPTVDAGADFSVCEGQSVTLTGSGTAVTYSWSGGVINGEPFTPINSDMYILTGTDANGCTGEDYIYVTLDALPTISAGPDIIVCEGNSVVLQGSGAEYYEWDNGIINDVSFFPPLGTTTYTVTGSLGNCQNTDQVNVIVNPNPEINAGNDISICSGQFITLSGSGGDYYEWQNGNLDGVAFQPLSSDVYVVYGYDLNGCFDEDTLFLTVNSKPTILINPVEPICSGEQSNLYATSNAQVFWYDNPNLTNPIYSGNDFTTPILFSSVLYYAQAVENGCYSDYDSAQVVVNAAPSINLTSTNSQCNQNNGSIDAIINGTAGPFDIYWSNGMTGVNSISNLYPGTYYIFVNDTNLCYSYASASITPSDVSIIPSINNIKCYGENTGSISVDIQGFGSSINYLWSTGSTTSSISNLSAGIYDVTINNGAGCEVSASYEITEAQEIILESIITPSNCGNNNGSININPSGGTGTYLYNWSSGQTIQDITNLTPGEYTITINDQNSCSLVKTFFVSDLEAPVVIGNTTEVNCNQNNGSVLLDIYPYNGDIVQNIVWSNGETSEDITNLTFGEYSCVITTQNGCVYSNSWTVTKAKPLTQEICIVTVDSLTTTNLVVWEKVQTDNISHYNIYRESTKPNKYTLVGTVDFDSISVFNDVVASPLVKSWRYKISAVDECEVESNISSHHKTINLTTIDLGIAGTKVVWDQYEGNIVFSSYNLLRYTDDTGWEQIAVLPVNTTTFIDNISSTTEGLDYMVQLELDELCTAQVWRAESFELSRSNKKRGLFNAGVGTGHPSNEIIEIKSNTLNIKVYPNPFENNISIEIDALNPTSIKLNDISGKTINNYNLNKGLNNIETNKLESGIYFIEYLDKQQIKSIKIVKQ